MAAVIFSPDKKVSTYEGFEAEYLESYRHVCRKVADTYLESHRHIVYTNLMRDVNRVGVHGCVSRLLLTIKTWGVPPGPFLEALVFLSVWYPASPE